MTNVSYSTFNIPNVSGCLTLFLVPTVWLYFKLSTIRVLSSGLKKTYSQEVPSARWTLDMSHVGNSDDLQSCHGAEIWFHGGDSGHSLTAELSCGDGNWAGRVLFQCLGGKKLLWTQHSCPTQAGGQLKAAPCAELPSWAATAQCLISPSSKEK